MKKKILVISEVTTGGEWHAIFRLFEMFTKHSDVDCFLIAIAEDGHRYSSKENKVFREIQTIYLPRGASHVEFLQYFIRNIFLIKKTIAQIQSQYGDMDFFFVAYYLSVFSIFLSFGFQGMKRTIYSFHGWKTALHIDITFTNYQEIFLKALERLALIMSSVIVVPSTNTISFIRKNTWPFTRRKKIIVVPNPISSYSKVLHSSYRFGQTKKIFYCGAIVERKGLNILLRAFTQFRKKNHQSILTIAYPKDTVDETFFYDIKTYIQRHKLAEHIRFVPSPSEKTLVQLYRSNDIGILPSYFEIQPLVVLESFSCSTPYIGTSVGDMGRLIASVDPNLILSENTADAIEKTLMYYYGLSRNARTVLREKAYEASFPFKEKYITPQFKSIFNV